MKPNEQRIAIAEACGWSPIADNLWAISGPEGTKFAGICGNAIYVQLPDYLNDLNAMHEAEKLIREAKMKAFFVFNLHYVVSGKSELDSYFATAAQRAEAFLRATNLWKE